MLIPYLGKLLLKFYDWDIFHQQWQMHKNLSIIWLSNLEKSLWFFCWSPFNTVKSLSVQGILFRTGHILDKAHVNTRNQSHWYGTCAQSCTIGWSPFSILFLHFLFIVHMWIYLTYLWFGLLMNCWQKQYFS